MARDKVRYVVRTGDGRELTVADEELSRRVSVHGDPVWKPNEVAQLRCYDLVRLADGSAAIGEARSRMNVVIVRQAE